jgi:LuxR family transcriptional regulator, maltose regulon positive regulatory protein
MMVKATPVLAMRGEVSTLLKWLDTLPRDMKQTNPRIPLMYGWAYFFMTEIEAVEPHLRDALVALGLEAAPAEHWPENISLQVAEMLSQVYALRTFVAVNRGEPEHGILIAREALSHLPADDRLSRFAILAALGDAYRDADNFAAASQAYSEALAVSEAIDQYAASLTMRMDLARLRVKMGQLRHAEAICRELLDGGGERYHPLSRAAEAYTLLGDIQRERNELDAAEKTLAAGIQQCEWAGYQRYLVFSHISAARLQNARGNAPALERSLDAAERIAALSGNEPLQAWVEQFRVRLLKRGEANWLANSALLVEDEGAFQREDEYLTLVRLHLDRARRARTRDTDPQPLLHLLERLLGSAQRSARIGSAIEIMLLQALALHLFGQISDAIQKVNQSLTLAEPEGYVRLFVDEGAPAAELLLLAIQHNIHTEYAGRLLKLIASDEQGSAGGVNPAEPLTEREGEVLRLLAAGLSNQAIAAKLVISLSTIKTHITRIYGKLDVTSRTQAVARAHELKIL